VSDKIEEDSELLTDDWYETLAVVNQNDPDDYSYLDEVE
jgi:hypothetical protein